MASTTVTVPLPDGDELTLELLMFQYTGEPCRLCRRMITEADLRPGNLAKFAGVSVDGTARAAHRVCWQNFEELLRTLPVERIHELMNSETVDVDATNRSEASE